MPIAGKDTTENGPLQRLVPQLAGQVAIAGKERECDRLGTFLSVLPYTSIEDVMKAYLNSLPMTSWVLLTLAGLIIAYPIAQVVVPAVVHAVVPDVVREMLRLI
jgi:hypothetical protein